MGRSRSSKDALHDNGMMPRKRKAEGGEVDKWMQKSSDESKKGALHRQLGIASSKKIPTERLEDAVHAKSPLLRKRANSALRYRGL